MRARSGRLSSATGEEQRRTLIVRDQQETLPPVSANGATHHDPLPLMSRYHRLTRPFMRALESRYRKMRRSIHDDGPRWLVQSSDYLLDRFDLAIIDHGVFRFIYANRHKVSDKVWRSAQPAPSDIALFARRGVR